MTGSTFLKFVIVVIEALAIYFLGFNTGYRRGEKTGMIRGATIAIQEIDRTVGKSLDKLIERLEKERK